MILFISALVFISIMLLVFGLTAPVSDKSLLNYRIDNIARSMSDDYDSMPSLTDAEMDASFAERIIRPMLRRLSTFFTRMTPAGATEEIRTLLVKAGNPGRLGVAEFIGLKIVSTVLLFALGIFVAPTMAGNDTTMLLVVYVLCLILGYLGPDYVIQQIVNTRQATIKRRLPDTIDLLIVSVEAGLGFDAAIDKVVQKQRGPLPDEFRRILDEMRLGKQRARALKDMAARVDIQELTTFVAAIYQSEQLGVSIANVLRVQSESIRVARAQQIREAAAKLPIKMLFPLIFCIFPAIFLVMMGPGLISIYNAFKHM